MISSSGIQCFLHAAETLSFQETANQLYFTRQAVSKQIIKLEQALEVQLFFRRHDRLELTHAGRLYRDFFSDTMERFTHVRRQAALLNQHHKQKVILAFPQMLAIDAQLGEAIQNFEQENTAYEVDLIRALPFQVTKLFQTHQVDILISFQLPELPAQKPYKSIHLADYPMVIAMHKEYPDREKVFSGEVPPNDHFIPVDRECLYSDSERRKRQISINLDTAEILVLMKKGLASCSQINTLCIHPDIIIYPTDEKSALECVWFPDDATSETMCLIHLLLKAFQK